MIWVSIQNGHYQWLKPMTLLALIWCNDVMAYFVGRLFGKRPLYSKISPKKQSKVLWGAGTLRGRSAHIVYLCATSDSHSMGYIRICRVYMLYSRRLI